MGLVVTNEATQVDYTLVCDGTALDSEFFVSLPPGQYRFLHVRDSRVGWVKTASGDWVPGGPSSGTFTSKWLLPFRIPYPRFEVRAGKVQYLGTIRFLGAGRDSSLLGGGSWLIENESAKTIKSFRERYPRITQQVVMAAMLEGSRRVEPSNVALYFDRGYFHAEEGQYDQALSYLTKALEYDPRHVRAYTVRGYAYFQKGQYDQAISDLTKALEINPRNADVYSNRARSYYSLMDHEKAWIDLRKAQELCANIDPRFLKDLREASGREK